MAFLEHAGKVTYFDVKADLCRSQRSVSQQKLQSSEGRKGTSKMELHHQAKKNVEIILGRLLRSTECAVAIPVQKTQCSFAVFGQAKRHADSSFFINKVQKRHAIFVY